MRLDKTENPLPWRVVRLTVALLAASLALLLAALLYSNSGFLHYQLLWNIFLAALPLPFALLLVYRDVKDKYGPLTFLWGGFWLVLFPNAPYMLTDFIHINQHQFQVGYDAAPSGGSWAWLAYVVATVLVGCLFGFLSLYLLHRVVRVRLGGVWGWVFCLVASGLSGVGIYIGRFMRFNSWDIFEQPIALMEEVALRTGWHAAALAALFAALTFGCYAAFYLCFDQPEKPGRAQAAKGRDD